MYFNRISGILDEMYNESSCDCVCYHHSPNKYIYIYICTYMLVNEDKCNLNVLSISEYLF